MTNNNQLSSTANQIIAKFVMDNLLVSFYEKSTATSTQNCSGNTPFQLVSPNCDFSFAQVSKNSLCYLYNYSDMVNIFILKSYIL